MPAFQEGSQSFADDQVASQGMEGGRLDATSIQSDFPHQAATPPLVVSAPAPLIGTGSGPKENDCRGTMDDTDQAEPEGERQGFTSAPKLSPVSTPKGAQGMSSSVSLGSSNCSSGIRKKPAANFILAQDVTGVLPSNRDRSRSSDAHLPGADG